MRNFREAFVKEIGKLRCQTYHESLTTCGIDQYLKRRSDIPHMHLFSHYFADLFISRLTLIIIFLN